ncbi:hypothetical protein ESOMN_v1c00310 [Williamsoniiplasma somnilux]|uniref:Uncharacterized protein n=1 Tax=Williamsoniiplasma somnilux TaxID=215578 RepID=A0A2K8NXA9_9MOLU|nr:ABC transporter permease subunit [Williamsoniiplasma somnilux]ATZ18417.1 hypothetical protein ESOMN_v1c00310 [Williamsoniiplasma somnilux]
MINLRLFKTQFSSIKIQAIIFILLPSLISLMFLSMPNYFHWTKVNDTPYVGAIGLLLDLTNIFSAVGFLIGFISISFIIVLFTKEINRGYMASWLTQPLSRKTIFMTKFALIITIIFITALLNFVIEALMSLRFPDFNKIYENVDHTKDLFSLFLLNTNLFLMMFLLASIILLFAMLIKKSSLLIILSLAFLILVMFINIIDKTVLEQITNKTETIKTLEKIIGWINILNLFDPEDIIAVKGDVITQTIYGDRIEAIYWKMPTTLVTSSLLTYISMMIFNKKDLAL